MSSDIQRASQHFVMSVLCRLGASASIWTGDRGTIDIMIEQSGAAKTIQVRGSARRREWTLRESPLISPSAHYYVLLYWSELIGDPRTYPEVWVVPRQEIAMYTRPYLGDEAMLRTHPTRLQREGDQFRDAWHLLGIVPTN